MKKSLEWHKGELSNLILHQVETARIFDILQKNHEEHQAFRKTQIDLLRRQIMEAERLGRNGFDAKQFMQRRRCGQRKP